MKITRKVPEPQPTLVTLEITLDELIALKTYAEYYASARPTSTSVATAADRFAKSISEKSYTWYNTDKLFR